MRTNQMLRIGELAKRANTTTKTIRYYERIGLIAPAQRGENRYRLYSPEALGHIRFIRQAKRMGLTLDEVAGLVALSRNGSGDSLRVMLEQILARKICETDQQIKSLIRFRDDLKILYSQLKQTTLDRCETCGTFMAKCDCIAANGADSPTPSP